MKWLKSQKFWGVAAGKKLKIPAKFSILKPFTNFLCVGKSRLKTFRFQLAMTTKVPNALPLLPSETLSADFLTNQTSPSGFSGNSLWIFSPISLQQKLKNNKFWHYQNKETPVYQQLANFLLLSDNFLKWILRKEASVRLLRHGSFRLMAIARFASLFEELLLQFRTLALRAFAFSATSDSEDALSLAV